MSGTPTNASFADLRAQEEEDGRSWQELFDENAVLREMVRAQMAAAPPSAASRRKQQQQQQQEDDGANQNSAVSSSDQQPQPAAADHLREVTQLRTELLSATRLLTNYDELAAAMSAALQSAFAQPLFEKIEQESREEEEKAEREQREKQSSDSSDLQQQTAEDKAVAATDNGKLSHVVLDRFRDGKPPPTSLSNLARTVDRVATVVSSTLPAHMARAARESRALVDVETHHLQQIVAELSSRLCQAEVMVREASALQEQRQAETAAKSQLERRLDEVEWEAESRLKAQERQSALLREQLHRSQKQLEKLTQEMQRSAMRAPPPPPAPAHSLASSTALSATSTTAATVVRARSGSINGGGGGGGGDNNSGAFASIAGGSTAADTMESVRAENVQLIQRLATQQERVWALESTETHLRAEIGRLNARIVQQAAAVRFACSVLTNRQQEHLLTKAAPAAPTTAATTAPAAVSNSSFSSFFSRSRSSSTATPPAGASSGQKSGVSGGAGMIPIEIVHTTELQAALEEALAAAAMWKAKAEEHANSASA
jgi:hypothetical protein